MVESNDDRILRRLQWRGQLNSFLIPNEAEALEQLHDALKPSRFVPPLTGKTSYSALALATEYLQSVDQPEIVVLGGGAATVWLGWCAKRFTGRVVSVQNDEQAAHQTSQHVDRHGLTDWVRVVHSPLVGEVGGVWYDRQVLTGEATIDLLLVAGPPTTTERGVRRHAMSFFANRLKDGALVLWADTDLQPEAAVAEQWIGDHGLNAHHTRIYGSTAMLFHRS